MKKSIKVVLIVIVAITALGAISAMFQSPADSVKEEKTEVKEKGKDGTAAYVMAQEIVKKQLKAPSTAKFQKMWDGVKVLYYTDIDAYGLTFWVDAQNSFGAMIRTTYDVTIKNTEGDKWLVTEIKELK